MSTTQWIAKSIRITERGHLVIDAEPEYGNRKKWEGEMEFRCGTEVLLELRAILDEQKAKAEMVEIAAAEIKEFVEDFKADYHKKKKMLADKLELEVDAIPKPDWWYCMEKIDRPVDVE